jgi:hypothetical protein
MVNLQINLKIDNINIHSLYNFIYGLNRFVNFSKLRTLIFYLGG